MSKITMKYSGKDYTLEYTRQSVRMIESQGFNVAEVSSKPVTMVPLLFQGAFIRHHKGIKRNLIDEIYEGIPNKQELILALVEMYSETVSSLIDDTDEGNVSWAVAK